MSKAPRSKKAWPVAAAGTAAVAAALILPSGAAFAATDPSGNTSVGSGNQGLLSLNLPVDICGLAVAVLGTAESGCQGGAVAQGAQVSGGSGASTNGTGANNTSVASGNKVSVPVSAPVNVCGVSLAILGSAQSGCQGGSSVIVKPAPGGGSGKPGKPGKPGWPGNPGGPSGPTSPGHHHHKHHHKHHKKSHTTTTTTTTTTSTSQQGGKSGTTSTTTTKTPTVTGVLASSVLPTTGANLAGLLAAALAFLGIGAGVVVTERRHRPARDDA
jgi:hypothetical protein